MLEITRYLKRIEFSIFVNTYNVVTSIVKYILKGFSLKRYRVL